MAQDIEPDHAGMASGPSHRRSVRIAGIVVTLVIVAVAICLFIQADPGPTVKAAHGASPDAGQAAVAAKPGVASAAVSAGPAPARN